MNSERGARPPYEPKALLVGLPSWGLDEWPNIWILEEPKIEEDDL